MAFLRASPRLPDCLPGPRLLGARRRSDVDRGFGRRISASARRLQLLDRAAGRRESQPPQTRRLRQRAADRGRSLCRPAVSHRRRLPRRPGQRVDLRPTRPSLAGATRAGSRRERGHVLGHRAIRGRVRGASTQSWPPRRSPRSWWIGSFRTRRIRRLPPEWRRYRAYRLPNYPSTWTSHGTSSSVDRCWSGSLAISSPPLLTRGTQRRSSRTAAPLRRSATRMHRSCGDGSSITADRC